MVVLWSVGVPVCPQSRGPREVPGGPRGVPGGSLDVPGGSDNSLTMPVTLFVRIIP